MEYITTKEASAKWGISTTRITVLANEGRIPGAQRIGRSWLIPVGATKPAKLKANRSAVPKKDMNKFKFPVYHLRPYWHDTKKDELSEQERSLFLAETAAFECRFQDAYPILESILKAPDDINIEIGALWSAGVCCIGMNKLDDFSKIILRLEIILSDDIPHRDDYVIILDCLKTYTNTMSSIARSASCKMDVHEESLPLTCMLMGYAQMTKEVMESGSAEISLLELNLRFLETTRSVIAVEMMHCYLLGIYFMRQNMKEAERHAEAAVKIAYENKLYFPIVSFYRYNRQIFSSALERYPKEFQSLCRNLGMQYEKNFTAFYASINKYAVISKLSDMDYFYAFATLTGLSNTVIADKLGVSPQTVKRRFSKMCEKLGVSTKKELKDHLHNYM